jgi:ubiquinol-cytochrome c reductase cytochrome c subunit
VLITKTARMLQAGLLMAGIAIGAAVRVSWAAPPDPSAGPLSEVATGVAIFRAQCMTCHGPAGDGAGGAPALDTAGLARQYPTRRALATFIMQNMPATAPDSLTPGEARAVAAYIESLLPPSRSP